MRRYITEYHLAVKDFKGFVEFLKTRNFEASNEFVRGRIVGFVNLENNCKEGDFVVSVPFDVTQTERKSDEGSLYVRGHTRLEQVVHEYCEAHRDS